MWRDIRCRLLRHGRDVDPDNYQYCSGARVAQRLTARDTGTHVRVEEELDQGQVLLVGTGLLPRRYRPRGRRRYKLAASCGPQLIHLASQLRRGNQQRQDSLTITRRRTLELQRDCPLVPSHISDFDAVSASHHLEDHRCRGGMIASDQPVRQGEFVWRIETVAKDAASKAASEAANRVRAFSRASGDTRRSGMTTSNEPASIWKSS